jgi:hypothetical protein
MRFSLLLVCESLHNVNFILRFQDLRAAGMKMTAFIALTIKAVSTSETSVYFNQTTRRYIPEGCHLHKCYWHENLCQVTIAVLTATSMKMTVFWDVAPCRLVETYRRFRGACLIAFTDDGGSKHLWNVGQFLKDYKTQYTSYSPTLELETSPMLSGSLSSRHDES